MLNYVGLNSVRLQVIDLLADESTYLSIMSELMKPVWLLQLILLHVIIGKQTSFMYCALTIDLKLKLCVLKIHITRNQKTAH